MREAHDRATGHRPGHHDIIVSIARSIGDGVCAVDTDGSLLFMNPAAERLLGWTEGELLGTPMHDVVHGARAACMRRPGNDCPLWDVMHSGHSMTVDHDTFTRKDGALCPVAYTASALLVDRQMLGAVVSFRDITERQRAEEALRVSERRFRALFEQSPLGLVLYAPDGLLLEANQAVLDTVLPEQAAGYNVLADAQLVAAGMMDDIRRAFAGEAVRLPPLYFDPARIPGAPRGRARWVRGSLYPVKDEDGVVRDVVAMIEDITEQQQAYGLLERRVEERTHELSTLLAVSRDVASTLELQPLLALILDRLKTVVDYTGAAVFLQEGEELVPADYRGPLSPEQVFALRVPVAQAVGFGEVSRRGGPVIIGDLQDAAPLAQELRAGPSAPLYATFGYVRSLIVVPLMVKERIIGVVGLAHGEPHYYTPSHAKLALAIANQAAVAIENARLYARAQEGAALEERARLARELHDAVTQTLFSASLIAELLPRLWERDPDAGRQRLEDVRMLTRGALAEMRTLLLELRPAALTDARLGDLLHHLAEAMAARKRLPVTLVVDGDRPLPPDVQVTLYRVAQEALNNIARHARATRVDVRLRSHDAGVELEIGDDGRGFDQGRIEADHFGLRIMRERADAVGATLTIQSRPGRGTQVRVVWQDPHMQEGA